MKTKLTSSLQKISPLIPSILTISALLYPAAVSAIVIGSGVAEAAESSNSLVCTKIGSLTSLYDTKLSNRISTLDQNRAARDAKLKTTQDNWQSTITAKRAQWDQIRDNNFTKLEAKATTDAQKSAVTAYESAVKAAVSTRRDAYDAAHLAFQNSLANAISSRRTTVDAEISTLQTQINNALSTASANCSSQGRAAVTTLKDDVKMDRQNFAASVKADDRVSQEVKQFQATRVAADKAADQVFQTAMQTARQNLLAAFKNSSTSVR